ARGGRDRPSRAPAPDRGRARGRDTPEPRGAGGGAGRPSRDVARPRPARPPFADRTGGAVRLLPSLERRTVNHLLYLYGFVAADAPAPPPLEGVGGAPVRRLDAGDVTAVVG